jgi:hypothetical protein
VKLEAVVAVGSQLLPPDDSNVVRSLANYCIWRNRNWLDETSETRDTSFVDDLYNSLEVRKRRLD